MLNLTRQIRSLLAPLPEEFRAPLQHLFNTLKLRTARDVLEQATAAKDEYQAVSLIWLLARIEGDSAVGPLLEQAALRAVKPAIRSEAIRGLIIHPTSKVGEFVRNFIARDTSVEVRVACAYALGHIRNQNSVDALIGLLANEIEAAAVRGMAAESLGALGYRSPQVFRQLQQSLSDQSREVVLWSAQAIAALGERSLLDDLLRASERFKDPEFRQEIDFAISILR